MLIVGAIGGCALALFAARVEHRDSRGRWVRVDRIAHAVGGLTFVIPVCSLSVPLRSVNTPAATVLADPKSPVPAFAAAVPIGRLRQVAITRIGGRHGP